MAAPSPEPGGFLPDTLPSPASSLHTFSTSNLPHPRAQPLRAGSSKEETTRRYVESRLLHVSRRYTKKFQPPELSDEVVGYRSIHDVCKELGGVADVLWLSGTPSLQIPYFLNIALSFSTYLSAFPADPIPTFALLRKLDHAFASLLQGHDVETGDSLPGFQGKRGGMSKTDMIRCKSLVETMRVQIVEVMSGEREGDGIEPSKVDNSEQTATDTNIDGGYTDTESAWDDEEHGHNMDVARVFEKTIVQLGDSLTGDAGYNIDS